MFNAKKLTGLAIATAAAGLFAAMPAMAAGQGTDDKVKCEGANGCKGQGACKTAKNDCAGKNDCKGKGWVSVSAKDCKDKGGKEAKKK